MTRTSSGPKSDGSLISGRFELGELIGSGGSASVFAASDITLPGSAVALKLLHPHLSGSEAERTAFFAEARAAERVEHPNVVRVIATGIHDSAGEQRAWIAFVRAPGETLDETVASRGSLAPSDALAVTDGILRALEAIHAAGLVHRDLSPSNVAVQSTPDGPVTADRVHVLDFGLADAPGRPALGRDVLRSTTSADAPDPTASADSDAALGVLGSVSYLSPEHALGRPVDERGDVYQVAALLHFRIPGRPPFVRATIGEVMAAHAAAPPPVPSVLVSGIPRSIDRIVVRGMLKQPDARFQSASDMRAAVLAAAADLQHRGPPARAPSGAPGLSGVTAAATAPIAPAASVPPQGAEGPRPRTVAAIVALSVVTLATIWLVAASSVPQPGASPTSGPSSSSAAHATPTPAATAKQRAPAAVPVPTFVGLTQAVAEQRAQAAGLVIGAVTKRDGTQPEGVVLASTPVAGVPARPGSSVTLVVASGSNAVPSVAGRSEVAAGSAITTAGFIPAERAVIDTTVPDGTVLGTEPGTGVSQRLGSTVVIVIARGPAPTPTPDPTSTPNPSPTGTPPTTTRP